MNAKSRASFMGAVFLLPFLSACSVGSDDPANSATIGCGDPAVMAGASEKLAEWFDQNVINRPGRNLQVTAKLVVGVSASVAGPSRHSRLFVSADGTHSTIAGDPSGSQRCAVYFSVGFRDADDTLFTGLVQQSFTTEFLLVSGPNGPQVTLDDPYNFMLDTGQFSASARSTDTALVHDRRSTAQTVGSFFGFAPISPHLQQGNKRLATPR
jgi:hypothetical protein